MGREVGGTTSSSNDYGGVDLPQIVVPVAMLVSGASFEVYARHRDVVFRARPWQLVLHAHIDHGIPIELLDQMYLGVSPSGTKTWKLPPASWLFDVWEKSDLRL